MDLQVNGYFGEEFDTAGAAGWATVVRRLPETGTTAFLPTIITAPLDRLAASLRATLALRPGLPRGARLLGMHVEGPFISVRRKGAHNAEWITEPTPAAVDTLLSAGPGLLRVVTLAPELDGALPAIARFTEAGVLVSVGHSDATAAQVAAAADAGARMVTHLFNAQPPMHHRAPGVVGQALADSRLTSGLIADFQHVAAAVCQIAFAAAPGRVCLVTDAAACAGMPPGRYLLGGEPIELPPGDGVPPVRADGTLAGSALRMDTAVANMVSRGCRAGRRGRGCHPHPRGPDRPRRAGPDRPGGRGRPGLAGRQPADPGHLGRTATWCTRRRRPGRDGHERGPQRQPSASDQGAGR